MDVVIGTPSGPGKGSEALALYLRKRDGGQLVTMSDAIGYLQGRFPSLAVAGAAITLGPSDLELDSSGDHDARFERRSRDADNSNRSQ